MAYKRISPQPIVEGGTGAATFTAHGVLLGEGTSAITPTAVGTNGQILVGASAADPGWVTPTAGTGLSVTANSTTHSYALSTPVTVANGGTGDTSLTAYAVLCGGTTSTNPIQSIASVGTSGQLLTSNGAGALPTFQTAGASSITITGDSGGGLTGSSFTFTGGTTGLTFAGAGSTETLGGTLVVANGGTGAATLTGVVIGNGTSAFTASAITQHDVLVGGTSNAITSVAPSATSGVPLISQGASSDPAFGTAVVAGGGTGLTSATAYAVLCGGTTSTGAFQSIASVGTSGQVLTSNGAGALPTFQAAPGGGVQSVVISLTNSQIKALVGTPITAVAAPASGSFVNIISAGLSFTYGGTNAFTNPSAVGISLFYSANTNAAVWELCPSNLVTATASEFFLGAYDQGIVTSSTANAGALIISIPSGSSNIAGNAANNNTMKVYVTYQILAL